MSDLWAALCLVLVLEGLFLFIAPAAWKRMAVQMLAMPPGMIRRFGGAVLAIGLIALYFVRGA